MANFNATGFDITQEPYKTALKLARELTGYCKIHSIPKTILLDGVAWDVKTLEQINKFERVEDNG